MNSYAAFLVLLVLQCLCRSYGQNDITPTKIEKVGCGPYETECKFFCCPYANAVCCWDGLGCCPSGKTCIDILGVGICVGIERSNLTITSEKPVGPRYKVSTCPSGTTTCRDGMCCPLPNAVCCADGINCCPHGYKCGAGACYKQSEATALNQIHADTLQIYNVASNLVSHNDKFILCPDGSRCSDNLQCCVDRNNEWSCCSKSKAFNQIPHSGENCCTTLFGWKCCTEYQTCTFMGCF